MERASVRRGREKERERGRYGRRAPKDEAEGEANQKQQENRATGRQGERHNAKKEEDDDDDDVGVWMGEIASEGRVAEVDREFGPEVGRG